MKGVIDRFEGKFAVIELENRDTKNVPRALLPPEAKEGDVIAQENGSFRIDEAETRQRRAEIKEILDSLWKKP